MYVAITTTGDGWYAVGHGKDKAKVKNCAEKKLAGSQWDMVKDMYTQTEINNLQVVSKTNAKRRFNVRL